MPKHIHADLMMKAVEIAQTDAEWWKYFEVLHDDADKWCSLAGEFYFDPDKEYRRKPRTIRIGKFDIPEPVREPPGSEQEYYYPFISDDDALYRNTVWWGDSYDDARFNRGLIHLDRESAELHAQALISLTQK
ncbi:hypothetical protein L7G72_12750 [Xenorhabdus bovienii]|uniref:hypothetical protein n=1 Tax=Xenorhabdus bovienii TaxID=40576 RepID=UPI001EDCF82D|nr:hypothetical protein [Xenorhabdus bovienii]MCG3462709.1 hypothetical protein [Xenorhabdus bovienii]